MQTIKEYKDINEVNRDIKDVHKVLAAAFSHKAIKSNQFHFLFLTSLTDANIKSSLEKVKVIDVYLQQHQSDLESVGAEFLQAWLDILWYSSCLYYQGTEYDIAKQLIFSAIQIIENPNVKKLPEQKSFSPIKKAYFYLSQNIVNNTYPKPDIEQAENALQKARATLDSESYSWFFFRKDKSKEQQQEECLLGAMLDSCEATMLPFDIEKESIFKAFDRAIKTKEELIKDLPHIKVELAISHMYYGDYFYAHSEYKSCKEHYEKARQHLSDFYIKTLQKKDHCYIAAVNYRFGELYRTVNQFELAKQSYKKARRGFENFFSMKEHIFVRRCEIGLAKNHFYINKIEVSKEEINRLLDKISYDIHPEDYIELLLLLGRCYISQAQHKEAEDCLMEAYKKLYQYYKIPQKTKLAHGDKEIPEIHQLSVFQEPVVSYHRIRHVVASRIVHFVGLNAYKCGLYDDAAMLFLEAVKINLWCSTPTSDDIKNEEALIEEAKNVFKNNKNAKAALSLHELANVYFRQARYQKAIELFEAVRDIQMLAYQDICNADTHLMQEMLITQNCLARVYMKLHRYADAEALLPFTLKNIVNVPDSGSCDASVILYNSAHWEYYQGNFAEALKTVEGAIAQFAENRAGEEKHLNYIRLLRLKAQILCECGAYSDAVKQLKDSLKLITDGYGGIHPDIMRLYWNLGDCHIAEGDYIGAHLTYGYADDFAHQVIGSAKKRGPSSDVPANVMHPDHLQLKMRFAWLYCQLGEHLITHSVKQPSCLIEGIDTLFKSLKLYQESLDTPVIDEPHEPAFRYDRTSIYLALFRIHVLLSAQFTADKAGSLHLQKANEYLQCFKSTIKKYNLIKTHPAWLYMVTANSDFILPLKNINGDLFNQYNQLAESILKNIKVDKKYKNYLKNKCMLLGVKKGMVNVYKQPDNQELLDSVQQFIEKIDLQPIQAFLGASKSFEGLLLNDGWHYLLAVYAVYLSERYYYAHEMLKTFESVHKKCHEDSAVYFLRELLEGIIGYALDRDNSPLLLKEQAQEYFIALVVKLKALNNKEQRFLLGITYFEQAKLMVHQGELTKAKEYLAEAQTAIASEENFKSWRQYFQIESDIAALNAGDETELDNVDDRPLSAFLQSRVDYREILQQYKNRVYEDALKVCEKLLPLLEMQHSENSMSLSLLESYVLKGRIHLAQGQYEKALKTFNQALPIQYKRYRTGRNVHDRLALELLEQRVLACLWHSHRYKELSQKCETLLMGMPQHAYTPYLTLVALYREIAYLHLSVINKPVKLELQESGYEHLERIENYINTGVKTSHETKTNLSKEFLSIHCALLKFFILYYREDISLIENKRESALKKPKHVETSLTGLVAYNASYRYYKLLVCLIRFKLKLGKTQPDSQDFKKALAYLEKILSVTAELYKMMQYQHPKVPEILFFMTLFFKDYYRIPGSWDNLLEKILKKVTAAQRSYLLTAKTYWRCTARLPDSLRLQTLFNCYVAIFNAYFQENCIVLPNRHLTKLLPISSKETLLAEENEEVGEASPASFLSILEQPHLFQPPISNEGKFVGRQEELSALVDLIKSEPIMVIHQGAQLNLIGGMGKTALAQALWDRLLKNPMQHSFSYFAWFYAGEINALVNQLQQFITEGLKLSTDSLSISSLLLTIDTELVSRRQKSLLVFDSVESYEAIKLLFHAENFQLQHITLLMTSCSELWRNDLHTLLELDYFSAADAKAYIQKSLPHWPEGSVLQLALLFDEKWHDALVRGEPIEWLDFKKEANLDSPNLQVFPFGLALAVSVIQCAGFNWKSFINLFKRCFKAQEQAFKKESNYSNYITPLLIILLNELVRQQRFPELAILTYAGYLSSHHIQQPLLQEVCKNQVPENTIEQGLQYLCRYGFFECSSNDKSYSIHRALQSSLRLILEKLNPLSNSLFSPLNTWLSGEQSKKHIGVLSRLVNYFNDALMLEPWETGGRLAGLISLLPHAKSVVEHARMTLDAAEIFALLLKVGRYQEWGIGHYQAAEETYQHALELLRKPQVNAKTLSFEQALEQEVGLLMGLGRVCYCLENYNKAIKYQEEALILIGKWEKQCEGDAWLLTRSSLISDLGRSLFAMGYYKTAQAKHEEALALIKSLRDAVIERDLITGNLALVYGGLGLHQKAIELYESMDVLKKLIAEKNIQYPSPRSKKDSQIKQSLSQYCDLVRTYMLRGNYQKAQEEQQKLEEITTRYYKAPHILLAENEINRGLLAQAEGEPEQALKYYRKAYDSYQLCFKEDSSRLAVIESDMAWSCYALGNFALAKAYIEKSIQRYEEEYEPNFHLALYDFLLLAHIAVKEGAYQLALDHLHKAKTIACKHNSNELAAGYANFFSHALIDWEKSSALSARPSIKPPEIAVAKKIVTLIEALYGKAHLEVAYYQMYFAAISTKSKDKQSFYKACTSIIQCWVPAKPLDKINKIFVCGKLGKNFNKGQALSSDKKEQTIYDLLSSCLQPIEEAKALLGANKEQSASIDELVAYFEIIKEDIQQLKSLKHKESQAQKVSDISAFYAEFKQKLQESSLNRSNKFLIEDKLKLLEDSLLQHKAKQQKLLIEKKLEKFSLRQKQHGLCLSQEHVEKHCKNSLTNLLNEINKYRLKQHYLGGKLHICYAWAHPDYQKKEGWEQSFLEILREHLRAAGITAVLDIKDNQLGNNIYKFMEQAETSDYVLVVGSQSLLKKHQQGVSALATELINIIDKRKKDEKQGLSQILPILLSGDVETALPSYFRMYTTIRSWVGEGYLHCLRQLIERIYNISEEDKTAGKFHQLWQDFLTKNPNVQICNRPLSDEEITALLSSEQQVKVQQKAESASGAEAISLPAFIGQLNGNNQNTIYFNRIANNGVDSLGRSGSCGYIAMDVTREQVLKVLLANIDNSDIRARVARQIENDCQVEFDSLQLNIGLKGILKSLMVGFHQKATERNDVIQSINQELGKLSLKTPNEEELIEVLKTIGGQGAAVNRLQQVKQNLIDAQKALDNFLSGKDLVEDYLKRNLPQEWLGAHIMLAYAQATQQSLRIWSHQKQETQSRELCLMQGMSYIHSNAAAGGIIDILHTNQGRHFERLVPLSVGVQIIKQSYSNNGLFGQNQSKLSSAKADEDASEWQRQIQANFQAALLKKQKPEVQEAMEIEDGEPEPGQESSDEDNFTI